MSKLAAELWQLARFSDPLSNFESRVEGSTNEIGYNSLLINIFFKKIRKKISINIRIMPNFEAGNRKKIELLY